MCITYRLTTQMVCMQHNKHAFVVMHRTNVPAVWLQLTWFKLASSLYPYIGYRQTYVIVLDLMKMIKRNWIFMWGKISMVKENWMIVDMKWLLYWRCSYLHSAFYRENKLYHLMHLRSIILVPVNIFPLDDINNPPSYIRTL